MDEAEKRATHHGDYSGDQKCQLTKNEEVFLSISDQSFIYHLNDRIARIATTTKASARESSQVPAPIFKVTNETFPAVSNYEDRTSHTWALYLNVPVTIWDRPENNARERNFTWREFKDALLMGFLISEDVS